MKQLSWDRPVVLSDYWSKNKKIGSLITYQWQVPSLRVSEGEAASPTKKFYFCVPHTWVDAREFLRP